MVKEGSHQLSPPSHQPPSRQPPAASHQLFAATAASRLHT